MKQSIRAQFRKILHPQAVVSTKVDGRPIQQDVVLMVCNFLFLYITCLLIGTFIMTVLGYDMITAFSAALSAISNVGPALGTLGPTQNFSTVPVFGLYTLTFLMLAGRLELYTILILLTKHFWIES
jgi:trk system potassium uptake protein TrkH